MLLIALPFDLLDHSCISSGPSGQIFLSLVCHRMVVPAFVFHVKIVLLPAFQNQTFFSFLRFKIV